MIKAGFILRIIALLFIFFIFSPKASYAAPKPQCNAENPGSIPIITSIITGTTSVTITWSQALDPVTHYTLAYGPTKEELIYGAPNIGSKGSGSFTVNELTPQTRYYFRIRAVNNCEPGDFSDTVSVVVGKSPEENLYKMPNLSLYKKVLGASTSAAKKHTVAVASVKTFPFCVNCFGLPLLVTQTILIGVFLYLSHKISYLRPMFALLFPVLFYFLFRFFHVNCSSNEFFCRYYTQVNIIL
nr:fibronectin type III domain-containing protein [Candidatus Levybacteria bacterium]